jgi:hypothetical protein
MTRFRALLLLAFIGLYLPLKAQEFKEIISKEVAIAPSAGTRTLTVNNVKGQVEVEGYTGNTIKIEVEKIITAPNQAQLELGKKEINIKVLEKGAFIYVFLDAPFSQFDEQSGRFTFEHFNKEMKFNYHFDIDKTSAANRQDQQKEEQDAYDYRLHYKIKVPQNIILDITSHEKGDITVRNLESERIEIKHLVGSINLVQVAGATTARTLAGNITVMYLRNPTQASRYHTTQGNITVTYQKGLNAELVFENRNIEIYSDFVSNELVEQGLAIKTQDKNKPAYLIKPMDVIPIGKNGPQLKFINYSGSVYIRKS